MSSTQTQIPKSASIQCRPTLYLDTAQPCIILHNSYFTNFVEFAQTPANAEDSSEGSEDDDDDDDDLFGTSFLPSESWGGGGAQGETSSSSSDDDGDTEERRRVTFNDADEDDDSFVQFEATSRSLMTPESSMASAVDKSSVSFAASPPVSQEIT